MGESRIDSTRAGPISSVRMPRARPSRYGELSSPNQASYQDEYERRLRLIRALISIGGLPVATVREFLDAVSSPDRPVHKVLGIAQKSITASGAGTSAPEADRASAERAVVTLIAGRGWHSRI